MDSQTLYQRVLGEDFARLPPILRQFHSLSEGGCAEGILAVQHGAGALRHLAARLLRLPREGDKVSLHLQIVTHDGHETWTRRFGKQSIKTQQWQEGPYLVEQAGAIQFVFKLEADKDSLTFHPGPSRVRGVRLPEALSLQVNARARSLGDSWNIEVNISAPLLGTITTYQGEITPRPCQSPFTCF